MDFKFYCLSRQWCRSKLSILKKLSIREGLIATKYFEKTKEEFSSTSGSQLQIKYKLSNAKICNNNLCFRNTFILIKNLAKGIILGTPFLTQIYLFIVDSKGIHTILLGEAITFAFTTSPSLKEINTLKLQLFKSR